MANEKKTSTAKAGKFTVQTKKVFKNLFNEAKLSSETRINEVEPKDWLVWLKHGFSEFFGTLFLTGGLVLLSLVLNTTEGGVNNRIEDYFQTPILVGLYAGFFIVGTVLIVCLRWSCDLNPGVTIYRVITGTNTYRYGAFKIVIQIVSGIIAGLIVYSFSLNNGSEAKVIAINSLSVAGKLFEAAGETARNSISVGAIVIFFGELLLMVVLLWPVFSKSVNNKYRDVIICFVIAIDVYLGILIGSAAINPARGLGQQVAGLFFGSAAGGAEGSVEIITATLALMAGGALAPFLYVFLQGLTKNYVNPWFTKAIQFKNSKNQDVKNKHSNKLN